MKIGTKGITLIKSFEGCKLKAYVCPAGVVTIGFGTTSGIELGMEILPQTAEDLLLSDLVRFEDGVNSAVKVRLTQYQFDSLVSFCYNVGISAFTESTLCKKLNKGDYVGAANEFPRWNKGGGKVLPGLVRRRESEKKLFLGQI